MEAFGKTVLVTLAIIITVIIVMLVLHSLFEVAIETMYMKNQGMIWLTGISVGVLLFGVTALSTYYQVKVEACLKDNGAQSKSIEAQNDKIISLNEDIQKKQKDYINSFGQLLDMINKNKESDNNLALKFVEATGRIEQLCNRFEKAEQKIEEHEKDIKLIKRKIKIR